MNPKHHAMTGGMAYRHYEMSSGGSVQEKETFEDNVSFVAKQTKRVNKNHEQEEDSIQYSQLFVTGVVADTDTLRIVDCSSTKRTEVKEENKTQNLEYSTQRIKGRRITRADLDSIRVGDGQCPECMSTGPINESCTFCTSTPHKYLAVLLPDTDEQYRASLKRFATASCGACGQQCLLGM